MPRVLARREEGPLSLENLLSGRGPSEMKFRHIRPERCRLRAVKDGGRAQNTRGG